MKKKRYRRRIYFLKETSQPRLLIAAQLILGATGLMASAALYFLFDRDLSASYFSAHITIRNVQQMLMPVLVGVNMFVLVLSAVVLLFYTHRIAGPAYRITRTLLDLAHGKLVSSPIRLRTGDYLVELADATNQLLHHLNSQVNDLKEGTKRLQEALDQIEAKLEVVPDEWEEARAALGQINLLVERCSPEDENQSHRSEE